MTGNPDHFLNCGLGAIAGGAGGKAWTGDNIFNSSNLNEVVVDGEVTGEIWSWHGSWSAQAGGKTYHGHKSRKKAAVRVEQVHRLRGQ